MAAFFACPVFAVENIPAAYVITIENVELKNSSGQWVSVIRPDKQVDLLSTEAAVSFFNNTGRVPAGAYEDFRVEFLKPDGQKVRLGASSALQEPLQVKKGSFIRVYFELDVKSEGSSRLEAKKADVTVDGRTEKVERLQWY